MIQPCLNCPNYFSHHDARALYCSPECRVAHMQRGRYQRSKQRKSAAIAAREEAAKLLTMQGISEAFGDAFAGLEASP